MNTGEAGTGSILKAGLGCAVFSSGKKELLEAGGGRIALDKPVRDGEIPTHDTSEEHGRSETQLLAHDGTQACCSQGPLQSSKASGVILDGFTCRGVRKEILVWKHILKEGGDRLTRLRVVGTRVRVEGG